MVEQQPERSPVIVGLAAISLASQLAAYGLAFWYEPFYVSSGWCAPGDDLCGLGIVHFAFLLTGVGALFGLAAGLGATVTAVRRREVLSALSIGLLLLVVPVNAFLLSSHKAFLASVGGWAMFGVVSAILLAISVTRRPTVRRLVAVAGLVLAVAVLVAINLVGG